MTKLDIFGVDNKKVGDIEVNEVISECRPNPHVIKVVVRNYQAGLRAGTHKTKGRSEVAGSTRKLFKQKGTGNARMGSSRSPIRRHGGIVFGPVVRDYSYKINRKEKQLALRSTLSQKIQNGQLVVLDQLKTDSPKTKDFAEWLKQWESKSYLLITEELSRELVMASRNLNYVKLLGCGSVNVFDLLKYEKALITKSAFKYLENLAIK